MSKKNFLSAFIILLAFSGCTKQVEVPEGYWVSKRGRPPVLITCEENNMYMATVYHICPDSSLCPIKYPIVRNSVGIYIQAEGRILVSYSSGKDILFLSPGGEYHRRTKTGIK